MDFLKADHKLSLVSKRPPLPRFLKQDLTLACQQVKILDTNRLMSGYRSSTKALKIAEKLDLSSLFVKRASLCKGTPRTTIKTPCDKPKQLNSQLQINLKQIRLQDLQKTLQGKQNISTTDDRSSRISTSYSEHALRAPKAIKRTEHIDEQLLRSEAFLRSKLSSKSWIAYDEMSKSVLFEKGSSVKRQMASLTKIMTCLVTLQVMDQMDLDISKISVIVTKKAASMIGTTAELVEGSELTIKQLLYGLMLPSGNDAAYTLAQYIGTLLCISRTPSFPAQSLHNPHQLLNLRQQTKKCLITFLSEMNRLAGQLGMCRTHYSNPHGLSDKQNYSTCSDLIKLCSYAMSNKQFAQIVSTKQYYCVCPETGREFRWKNTHKLLEEDGWCGVKTGVTPAAGPCLASCYGRGRQGRVFVVLLGCENMELRYEETKMLLEHCLQHKSANQY